MHDKHLKILLNGVEKWNQWRIDNSQVKPELSGVDLERLDLENINFSEANLEGALLAEADLSNANLQNANLNKADFYEATLINANLSNCNFSEANLSGANLNKAICENANFNGAELYTTTFVEAILNKANLAGANLIDSNLDYADLSESILDSANLLYASMKNAVLRESDLAGANLEQTNLANAILDNANLESSKFLESNLTNTSFFEAVFDKTIIGNTELSRCLNLETAIVYNKCIIDLETIKKSHNISITFLHKLGYSESILEYIHDFTNISPIQMFPVFLSHSWSNKEFARKLYNDLINEDIHCWFDEKKTKPGDRIISVISKGIKDYDKMVLICSKESLSSWWVEREIERILDKERSYNKGKREKEKINLLIPITIDDFVFEEWDSPWATEIKRYIVGDFRNWKNSDSYKNSLSSLIKGLQVEPKLIMPPSFL